MSPDLEIREDDPASDDGRALIARHLAGMYAASPPDKVHAFGVAALQHPDVTFWLARVAGEVAGCAAFKQLDPENGELKSMRVADPFLGRGIGRALLVHVVEVARGRGVTTLWLETGSGPAFDPAIRMYETAGFTRCGPFGDYVDGPFSVFMTRRLAPPAAG